MEFVEKLRKKAKGNKKIVFPEATDERILKASEYLLKNKICKIVLVGNEKKINEKIKEKKLKLEGIEIIECKKGKELEKAINLLNKELVDGMIAGATHSTATIARNAIKKIGLKKGVKTLSGAFLIILPHTELGEQGVFLFSDCGITISPNAEQLAEIALNAGKFFKTLTGKKARIALLSFSTLGSATHESLEKIRKAKQLIKEKEPKTTVDGELQVDAAIVQDIQKIKAPNSEVKGKANVLIFPDLHSGNIAYKITEKLAKARAIGPLLLGTKKPVNDLSRGCSVEDIIDSACITLIEAKQK